MGRLWESGEGNRERNREGIKVKDGRGEDKWNRGMKMREREKDGEAERKEKRGKI